jgi:hypothetical protein
VHHTESRSIECDDTAPHRCMIRVVQSGSAARMQKTISSIAGDEFQEPQAAGCVIMFTARPILANGFYLDSRLCTVNNYSTRTLARLMKRAPHRSV